MHSKIIGISASGGKAKGIAKVIFSDKDIYAIKEGDILVCKLANPSFTPLLNKLRGIVTDYGGITAHAAIVARELGIPCVTGTKDATKKIKNGEQILVDGDEGIVYKL